MLSITRILLTLLALIGLFAFFVMGMALIPNEPILSETAMCIATTKDSSEITIYAQQIGRGINSYVDEPLQQHELKPRTILKSGELVRAQPVSSWSESWCNVEGVGYFEDIVRMELDFPDLYAKINDLRAVPAEALPTLERFKLPSGLTGLRANLETAFAMELLDYWGTDLNVPDGRFNILWESWIKLSV